MESRSFVVLNVPEVVDEAYLRDYLECVLNQPLEHLECLPQVPDRALFTLQHAIDVGDAALMISKNLLESCQLTVEATVFRDAVIAEGEDLIAKVPPLYVMLYFENEFGGCEEIVSRCLAIDDYEMIFICFKDSEVLTDILKDPIHYPLPSVRYEMKVSQFCDNFHGAIPYGSNFLYQMVDGTQYESIYKPGNTLYPAYPTKVGKLQDEEHRGGQEIIARKTPHFDLKDKVQVQKESTGNNNFDSPMQSKYIQCSSTHPSAKHFSQTLSSPSVVNKEGEKEADFSIASESDQVHYTYLHSKMEDEQNSVIEIGRVKKFDQQNISELPAENLNSHYIPLDDHAYPSKSFYSHHTDHRKDFSIAPKSDQVHYTYPHLMVEDEQRSVIEIGKVKMFHQHSISELPAENMNIHYVPLDNHAYPSKSFYDHRAPQSFSLNAQAQDNERPQKKSHNVLHAHDSEHKNSTLMLTQSPMLTQSETAPYIIDFSLKKSHWYLLKDTFRSMKHCYVSYDALNEVLVCESIKADAIDEESIEELVTDVIECSEELSESKLKVFETAHGKRYFKSYVLSEWSEVKDIFVDIKDGFLMCCGFDENKIDEVKQKVMSDLFTLVEVDSQSLSMEALEKLKENLESKYKVHIFWNEKTDRNLQIIGVRDDVITAKDLMQTTVYDSTIKTKSYEFSGDMSAYIVEYCVEEIDDILKSVESSVDGAHDKFSIEYSGKLKEVEKASSALDNLLIALKAEEIDVRNEFFKDEADLIVKELSMLSSDDPFQHTHDLFMANHKCLILNDLKEESNSQSSPSLSPAVFQAKAHSPKTCVSKEAIFILNSFMQLKIKDEGNIIHERSDVLVCVLHESRQFTKTSVGNAFLKIEKDLQNTVNTLSFSSNGVELVLFNSHKVKCKAVVFMILSSFEQGVAEDYLQKAILEVLIKAAEFKATSISFPPIGLGRVMKYPEGAISEQFFLAVKEFVDKHSSQYQLQKIKFLACNRGLFYNLNKRGKTLYRKIIKNKDTKEDKGSTERRDGKDHVVDGDEDSQVMNAKIRIMHRQSEGLASCWKTELKNYVNHEQEIDTMLESLPKSLNHKIKTKLKTVPVLITSRISKLGRCIFKVKGSMDHVMLMKVYIAEEIVKEGKGPSPSPLAAVPHRGGVAFMKYKASLPLSVPIYWNKKYSENPLQPVNDRTKQGIEKMLLTTWKSAQVGLGRDAAGIPPNSKLEFVSVQRIECPAAYTIYAAFRKGLLERKVKENKVCTSINEMSSNGQVLTYVNLPDFMKQELCGEINEHYLFHGTKQEIVSAIIKQGCHPNLGNPSAMFGKGVYAAESSTKADQYTDDPKGRLPSGTIHFMFLTRMLLGDVFKCTKNHPSVNGKDSDKFVRPPCKKCGKDKCACGDNFDSVMGEDGWIFREFVVYQPSQCYPEYLIKYKRI